MKASCNGVLRHVELILLNFGVVLYLLMTFVGCHPHDKNSLEKYAIDKIILNGEFCRGSGAYRLSKTFGNRRYSIVKVNSKNDTKFPEGHTIDIVLTKIDTIDLTKDLITKHPHFPNSELIKEGKLQAVGSIKLEAEGLGQEYSHDWYMVFGKPTEKSETGWHLYEKGNSREIYEAAIELMKKGEDLRHIPTQTLTPSQLIAKADELDGESVEVVGKLDSKEAMFFDQWITEGGSRVPFTHDFSKNKLISGGKYKIKGIVKANCRMSYGIIPVVIEAYRSSNGKIERLN